MNFVQYVYAYTCVSHGGVCLHCSTCQQTTLAVLCPENPKAVCKPFTSSCTHNVRHTQTLSGLTHGRTKLLAVSHQTNQWKTPWSVSPTKPQGAPLTRWRPECKMCVAAACLKTIAPHPVSQSVSDHTRFPWHTHARTHPPTRPAAPTHTHAHIHVLTCLTIHTQRSHQTETTGSLTHHSMGP